MGDTRNAICFTMVVRSNFASTPPFFYPKWIEHHAIGLVRHYASTLLSGFNEPHRDLDRTGRRPRIEKDKHHSVQQRNFAALEVASDPRMKDRAPGNPWRYRLKDSGVAVEKPMVNKLAQNGEESKMLVRVPVRCNRGTKAMMTMMRMGMSSLTYV